MNLNTITKVHFFILMSLHLKAQYIIDHMCKKNHESGNLTFHSKIFKILIFLCRLTCRCCSYNWLISSWHCNIPHSISMTTVFLNHTTWYRRGFEAGNYFWSLNPEFICSFSLLWTTTSCKITIIHENSLKNDAKQQKYDTCIYK